MGNYFFENQEKELLKVEYTFGFIKINSNELRINLHHSSLLTMIKKRKNKANFDLKNFYTRLDLLKFFYSKKKTEQFSLIVKNIKISN